VPPSSGEFLSRHYRAGTEDGGAARLRELGNLDSLWIVNDPYVELGERFVAHYESLRGAVRHDLMSRQLQHHLRFENGRILDVGGGAGHQSLPLARAGHEVTILDPSVSMLARAEAALASEDGSTRRRVRLKEGRGEDAERILAGQSYDAVLCHGVLMYLQDPTPLLRVLVAMTGRDGVISILFKNAAALALRPALQQSYERAIQSFGTDRDVGGLGVVTRGDRVEDLSQRLENMGATTEAWYGIRVLTDHLFDAPVGDDYRNVLEAESLASRNDPYRSVGRLIHLVARRR
jgi:ubiquinone/menaquinone biosynthesis C-methylase UbiE